VTKCPSVDCVRLGFPGYPQTLQPDVEPVCSPWRTAASQELLRTEPFHVKLREWLCPTPFDTRKIVALEAWLKVVFASLPPGLMMLGSDRRSVPELRATLEFPVTSLVSAEPLQPLASEERLSAPTGEVLISRRYPPGAVAVKVMLCCALLLESRVART